MDKNQIFAAYYQLIQPNQVIVLEDSPYIESYVPYVRAQTNVIAFNFFRINYNLRDPLVLKIWVGSISTDRSITRIFAPGEIYFLDAAEIDALANDVTDCSSLHIRLYHPAISTPMGEFRFFGVYHRSGRGCAGVHSLGVRGLVPLGDSLGSRAVLPTLSQTISIDPHRSLVLPQPAITGEPLTRLRPVKNAQLTPSFFVSTDLQDVTTVWHDSDLFHHVQHARNKSKVCQIRQAFPVPDFPENAPYVWIATDQVGYASKTICFEVSDRDGALLGKKDVAIVKDGFCIDLAEIFGELPSAPDVSVVAIFDADQGDFESPALAYLQLYYRSQRGLGDQVHSQITPSFWTDTTRWLAAYRCRKFAPWFFNVELEWLYVVINIGGNGMNKDQSIKWRIMTDDGRERILEKTVLNERLTYFYAQQLLDELGLMDARAAIFQIEAETTNFNAYWILRDRSSRQIGIDHFTGG
jgi:hypothetical protein